MMRPNHHGHLLQPLALSSLALNTVLILSLVRGMVFNTLAVDAFAPIMRMVMLQPAFLLVAALSGIYVLLVWWAWWRQLTRRRRRNSRFSTRSLLESFAR